MGISHITGLMSAAITTIKVAHRRPALQEFTVGSQPNQSDPAWRDNLPELSVADIFRRVVDDHLHRFPEIDLGAERYRSRDRSRLGVVIPTTAGGKLELHLPLNPATQTPLKVLDIADIGDNPEGRRLISGVSTAFLLTRTLPSGTNAEIDFATGRVSARGRGWESIESSMLAVGIPPRWIVERNGETSAEGILPRESIGAVRSLLIAGQEGAAREFISNASRAAQFEQGIDPVDERQLRSEFHEYLSAWLTRDAAGAIAPLIKETTAAMSSLGALPTEDFRYLERHNYLESAGMAAALEIQLGQNEVFIVAWNEITHDVRAEAVQLDLLEWAPPDLNLRVATALQKLPPAELVAQRIVVFIGPVDLRAPFPDQFLSDRGTMDRLSGFAPDIAPDVDSVEGRAELIRQKILSELFKAPDLRPAQVTVTQETNGVHDLNQIFFNSVTGGFTIEISGNMGG
jgi:hypothetical protein